MVKYATGKPTITCVRCKLEHAERELLNDYVRWDIDQRITHTQSCPRCKQIWRRGVVGYH